MKKIILSILILITVSCSKKEDATPAVTTGQITFYMGITSHSYHLLVDGIDKGSLRGSTIPPLCGDSYYLTLNLSLGSHTFDVKSMDGFAWGNPITYTVKEGCITYKAR